MTLYKNLEICDVFLKPEIWFTRSIACVVFFCGGRLKQRQQFLVSQFFPYTEQETYIKTRKTSGKSSFVLQSWRGDA